MTVFSDARLARFPCMTFKFRLLATNEQSPGNFSTMVNTKQSIKIGNYMSTWSGLSRNNSYTKIWLVHCQIDRLGPI